MNRRLQRLIILTITAVVASFVALVVAVETGNIPDRCHEDYTRPPEKPPIIVCENWSKK